MNKKLIVFIIDESTNKIILSNNFSNVDVKYVLINYNNKDKPLIKSSKYTNVSIQNENKDSLEIFLNTNQPKLIYLTVPKLTNIVENYINTSNKDIFIFSNQSLQIKNNNCILSKSMKIDKFLSFAFEKLGIKTEKSDVIKTEKSDVIKTEKSDVIKTEKSNVIKREKSDVDYDSSYFNKIQDYCNLTKCQKFEILKNKKEEFRYFGYRYLDYIRLLELPVIKRNNKNEAVLIEFRILHHLEFLIRNCIYKLGEEWSHTIVCGNLNYEYINNIINSMNRDIKIIKIDVDNLTQLSYNSMLLTKNFWNNFIGEKILIKL
jgi:hypothetical protein